MKTCVMTNCGKPPGDLGTWAVIAAVCRGVGGEANGDPVDRVANGSS